MQRKLQRHWVCLPHLNQISNVNDCAVNPLSQISPTAWGGREIYKCRILSKWVNWGIKKWEHWRWIILQRRLDICPAFQVPSSIDSDDSPAISNVHDNPWTKLPKLLKGIHFRIVLYKLFYFYSVLTQCLIVRHWASRLQELINVLIIMRINDKFCLFQISTILPLRCSIFQYTWKWACNGPR